LLISKTKGFDSLFKFNDLLRKEQILPAARKVLKSGIKDQSIIFYLNKQVAYVKHISFSQKTAESPLGPIKVKITTDTPQKIIDLITKKPKKRISSPS
jgi:predicted RNA binding protein with dsRBD fold (UPF0201 family)